MDVRDIDIVSTKESVTVKKESINLHKGERGSESISTITDINDINSTTKVVSTDDKEIGQIVGENGTQYACNKCGYITRFRKDVAKHIKLVHDKIKDFVCNECN